MQIKLQIQKGSRFSVAAMLAVALTLVFVLTACSSNNGTGGTGNTENNNNNSNSVQAIKDGDNLVIQISEISETAKFYPVTVDGTRMEVVAVKAPDGTIRTAFNTCQVCNGSPKAYFEQSGTTLQCQNCGNKFPMSRVEIEAGGCNPVPIFDKDKTVTDESIAVPYATLKANKSLFSSNWKQS